MIEGFMNHETTRLTMLSTNQFGRNCSKQSWNADELLGHVFKHTVPFVGVYSISVEGPNYI